MLVCDESFLFVQMTSHSENEDKNFEKFREMYDPDGVHSENALRKLFYLSDCNPELATECSKKFFTLWDKTYSNVDSKKVLEEVATKKFVFGGLDEEGRRIVHFYYKMHDPKQFALDNTMTMFMEVMDVALDNKDTATKGMIFICWMRDSGWSNFDLASERYFTETITSLQPMSLKMMNQMIMVDSPWYVWAAMKLMSPFLTPEIRSKLFMFSEQELRSKFSPDALKPNNLFLDAVSSDDYTPWK